MSAGTTPPPGVLRQAEERQRAIGLEPIVEQVKANRWRVTFRNERVAVTFDYKTSPRVEQVDSTLTVDGQPRRLAKNLEHLTQFFKDTTATLAALHVPIEIPEATDLDSAPPPVKHTYGTLVMHAQKRGSIVRASQHGVNEWHVGIYLETRLVEVIYTRQNGKWANPRGQRLRLVIDNEDISHEIRTLKEALRHLFGDLDDHPEGKQAIGRKRGVQGKATSVQVRNTTVIRN